MRKAPLVIILILLILGSSPLTSAKGVSEPTQRDVFLYEYFSQVLIRFEYSLKYASMNSTYGVTLANMTFNELRLINQESLYYQERGINSTVTFVIPPFYRFSEELLILTNLTLEFQRNPSPGLSAGILSTIGDMEHQLRIISLMKLRNGTKVLTFNTQPVQRRLDAIKKMVSKQPAGKAFTIGVSDSNPIIRQNITIFGATPWNDTVTVVVKGDNGSVMLQVTPSNGLFSTKYSFEEQGEYTLYAIHGTNRSNTILITVRKIPTMFLVESTQEALLNHTLVLRGVLIDYYGNRLPNREIKVGNKSTFTNSTGGFSRTYFSPVVREFAVRLTFKGDSEHAPTSKTVRIVFTKYPVSITLKGPSEITLGETAAFTGKIEPALNTTLLVYVNGKENSTITAENGSFSFTLRPENAGEVEVHVSFPGNDVYEKASSEVIVLKVIAPGDETLRYAGAAILGILLIAGVLLSGRRRRPGEGGESNVEKVEKGDEQWEGIIVPNDVGEAYTLLRNLIRDRFGISESATPREMLGMLKGWELYPLLERATLLHEKAIYGGLELSLEEVEEFEELIKELTRGLA